MNRFFILFALFSSVIAWGDEARASQTIKYEGSNRLAFATFESTDGMTLQITLREATPASAFDPPDSSDAILTSIGFQLPGSTELLVSGSGVMTGPNSQSVGFDTEVGGNEDVSGEFGVGNDVDPGNGGSFDLVSALQPHVNRLSGANLDGPPVLNGPQGGLLADSDDRGGLGVIDDTVIMSLKLDTSLNSTQQQSFLTGLSGNTIVEYGSDAAFVTGIVVPEPSTLLVGLGCIVPMAVVGYIRRRRQVGSAAA